MAEAVADRHCAYCLTHLTVPLRCNDCKTRAYWCDPQAPVPGTKCAEQEAWGPRHESEERAPCKRLRTPLQLLSLHRLGWPDLHQGLTGSGCLLLQTGPAHKRWGEWTGPVPSALPPLDAAPPLPPLLSLHTTAGCCPLWDSLGLLPSRLSLGRNHGRKITESPAI